MWFLLLSSLGIFVTIPLVSRAILINEHNNKMKEALKMLTKSGDEMKWPVVREYIRKIANDMI